MEPNATLNELRDLISQYQEYGDIICNDPSPVNDYDRIVELFDALDHWLSNGGALPQSWKR